ncbi:MAG TPA: carbamoyl phosphate synthase large subunit, partial [Lachnospiraceae bacterium]|nr:carbamoyl phosphate synthase large subunit [Lachnospiraceae bacterium]
EAYYKAQEATQNPLPLSGTVLISVNDRDKAELIEVARAFYDLGFKLIATGGTCDMINGAGIPAAKTFKLQQGRPNILDAITNHEVDLVINTPDDKKGAGDDSYIRKGVIKARIPYITTMAAARASAAGIKTMQHNMTSVRSLQSYHSAINAKDQGAST